ncbi:hypothetical protein VN97_g8499 [Penicillium thymicola]|uniref:Uncharacterized protein n=1 Tax=Penicillium thymicola TaxID=293382 RepID=A0AAI9TEC9_PENTH|nr:hypothetical protein VN97_g8499 [Penicillium thymicola]
MMFIKGAWTFEPLPRITPLKPPQPTNSFPRPSRRSMSLQKRISSNSNLLVTVESADSTILGMHPSPQSHC